MSWCLGVHHWACAETSQSSGAPEKGTISSAAIARPHTCKESLNWLREVGHRLPAPVFPQLCLHLSLHHPPAKPCLPVPRTWASCAPPTHCLEPPASEKEQPALVNRGGKDSSEPCSSALEINTQGKEHGAPQPKRPQGDGPPSCEAVSRPGSRK